jgi:hypothetical protein
LNEGDEPDDPDAWRDHADDRENADEERAEHEGWPRI